MAGQGLLDLANRVAELERDIRLMRGELEKQAFLINQQKGGQVEGLAGLEARLDELARQQSDLADALAGSAKQAPAEGGLAGDTGDEATQRPDAEATSADVSTKTPVAAAEVPDDVLTVPLAAVIADSAGENPGSAPAAPTVQADAEQTDLLPPEAPNQIALTGAVGNTTSSAPSEGAAVKAEYQDAFDLLKSGDYPAAVVAFREFLLRNPQSEYSDNAQYWLGESFYVTEDYAQAIVEYRTLLEVFPESQKFTHALLKIGYAQEALGESAAARNTLEGLARDYPNTTAARLAAERLQQLPEVPVEPEFVP